MKRALLVAIATVLFVSGCGGGNNSDVFVDGGGGDFTFELLAVDDEYSTFQNQSLAVGAFDGVLANDFICDCPDFDIDWPTTTASGGTLTGNDDGSFFYAPPPFFTGSDFFEYRISDDFSSSTGRVTIGVNLPPQPVAFVDSLNGSDATGSVNGGAFATIGQAVSAAGVNGVVVIAPGNGSPYVGAVNLLEGQTLVGEDFQEVLAQGEIRPFLSGPVNMANNCKVRGLTLDGGRIDGSSAQDGEVSQCDFFDITGYAIDLDGATGTWLVTDNIVENCGGGLSANLGSGLELVLTFEFNTVQNCTQSAVRLLSSGTGFLTVGVFDNLFQGNQAGFTFEAIASNSSDLCLDLDGNQNDDTYRLDGDGGLFQVEQLTLLTTLNTGTVTEPGDPLTDVANGFCGF
jgi:Big-like domain-containing protein